MNIRIDDLDHIREAAREFIQHIGDHRVFAFYGKMGAGKTTFVKAICEELGVSDVITSPTFAIINEYWTEAGEPLYHFDFYRIDEPADATRVGFEEYLYSGHYCFIEWTEKVEEILQGDYIPVTIERVDDDTRLFKF